MTAKRTVLLLVTVLPVLALADDQSPTNGAWQTLRPQLYGQRAIGEGGDLRMSVDAPASTPDPAATPVVVHFGGDLLGHVRQVRVIIDNNPSPLVTTMQLAANLPVDQIDLRVRIDRYTSVRAIAETDDGHLEMRSAWVNASGGCSMPPAASTGGVLGQIRLRTSDDDKTLQISIRHPNNSGFQVDPRSGDLIPPHFIGHIRLSAGGQTLMEADTGISLSEMRAKARRLKQAQQGRLDLIIVDYLQLMSGGSKRYENRTQEVSAISRGLKALAKELSVPVIALSQLSRAPESRGGDHRPQLADLRESGSIEQDADLVMFIFREEIYKQDDPDLQGKAEIIIGKQRNGPTGKIMLAFRKNCTRFETMVEGDFAPQE